MLKYSVLGYQQVCGNGWRQKSTEELLLTDGFSEAVKMLMPVSSHVFPGEHQGAGCGPAAPAAAPGSASLLPELQSTARAAQAAAAAPTGVRPRAVESRAAQSWPCPLQPAQPLLLRHRKERSGE